MHLPPPMNLAIQRLQALCARCSVAVQRFLTNGSIENAECAIRTVQLYDHHIHWALQTSIQQHDILPDNSWGACVIGPMVLWHTWPSTDLERSFAFLVLATLTIPLSHSCFAHTKSCINGLSKEAFYKESVKILPQPS